MSQPDPAPTPRADVEETASPGGRPRDGWWERSVRAAPSAVSAVSAVSRRTALQAILVTGGVVAGLGVDLPEAAAQVDPELRLESRPSIEMQRTYGWSFGAAAESLIFDGESTAPFDRGALSRLPEDLRPVRPRHVPFYVPTLFQAPAALPRAVPAGDVGAIASLRDALRPIHTRAMEAAYQRGRALGALYRNVWTQSAVIVDLPGPEAVAFAAGAADVLDPVFLFDNWPHPRGVVPAHLTLAAAVYYQPLFARRAAPAGAAPLFVLDRARIDPYTDDSEQFDNRYVARLPSAEALEGIDVAHVLYVAPTAADALEIDDLNEEFVGYAAAGLDVKIVAADAFGPDPAEPARQPLPYVEGGTVALTATDDRTYYYGYSSGSNFYFWLDYPWLAPGAHVGRGGHVGGQFEGPRPPYAPAFPRPGTQYHPVPRPWPFGAMTGGRPHPHDVGHVKVVVAARSGVLLGAALSRSGSWNRASSGGSGAGG